MAAAEHGNLEVVTFLLAREDTNVNDITSSTGNTALYFAAMNGHVEVVRELLMHGATNNTNKNYDSPLDIAKKMGIQKCVI